MSTLNPEVTLFLDELHHPQRELIELLRVTILSADKRLAENIKWNGPNYYTIAGDRITMKIQPPKQVQLIFHRGAKVQAQPKEKMISDSTALLDWKENDRAIAAFKSVEELQIQLATLKSIIQHWVLATN